MLSKMSKRLLSLLLVSLYLLLTSPSANALEIPLLTWERGKVQNIVVGDASQQKNWTIKLLSEKNVEITFTNSRENSRGFIVYSGQLPANISNWSEELLDVDFQTIQQLESFLDNKMSGSSQPLMFKLAGFVKEATIHIVNLPAGAKVSSPNDAHKGQVKYQMENQEAEIVGFFSKEHKAIFTHHDTYLHMHLITKDKQMMGHLDELSIEMGKMRLFLCQN
jgi:hypothetical protein